MGGGELNEIGVSIRNHTSSTKHSLFTRVLSVVFLSGAICCFFFFFWGGGGWGSFELGVGVKKSHVKSKR